MKKICSKCKVKKELVLFYRDSSSKDGRRSSCSDCSKKYREDNKDRDRLYRRDYHIKNKEAVNEKSRINYDPTKKRKYYLKNKEDILIKRKIKYENNREEKIKYQSEYQKNNKDKRNKYLVERRNSDPLFKLITNTRNLIYNSFYYNGYSKNSKTEELLGCSFDELKVYLESKFENWMTWENRGLYNGDYNYGWDIDHIIPLASVDNEEDLIRLNHYTNLQPLCSKINRDIKKNNIEYGII